MFRLWSQIDLGYGDTIFTSVERGREILEADEYVQHLLEQKYTNCKSVGDLIADGIMGFRPQTVI